MELEISKAKETDINSILEIYSQPSIDHGKTLAFDDAKAIWQKMKSYPSYHIYLAKTGEKAVGTIAVLIMDNLGHMGRPSAILESVAVLPPWQNRGVGKALLRYAIDKCQARNCYKISLSANIKREKAHAFYQSLGFVQHGYSYCYMGQEENSSHPASRKPVDQGCADGGS